MDQFSHYDSKDFEIAMGGIRGGDHEANNSNGQDAYSIVSMPNNLGIVGIVCDGCGSCPHSEVGAKMFAKALASGLARNALTHDSLKTNPVALLNNTRDELLGVLSVTVDRMLNPSALSINSERKRVLNNYFLFTTMGFIIYKNDLLFFCLGDGVMAINDCVLKMPSWPDNKPPYLAYWLCDDYGGFTKEQLDFQFPLGYGENASEDSSKPPYVHPLGHTDNILVGSDGLRFLIDNEKTPIPTRQEELIGPLSQFWENNFFFKNPDGIRRRLAIINRPRNRPDWKKFQIDHQAGCLRDDIALIVMRFKRLSED